MGLIDLTQPVEEVFDGVVQGPLFGGNLMVNG